MKSFNTGFVGPTGLTKPPLHHAVVPPLCFRSFWYCVSGHSVDGVHSVSVGSPQVKRWLVLAVPDSGAQSSEQVGTFGEERGSKYLKITGAIKKR